MIDDEIGIVCRVGADPNRPHKINQDAYFQALFHHEKRGTETNESNNNKAPNSSCVTCVGVLDGNGLKGHIVSQYFARHLPALVHYYVTQQSTRSNSLASLNRVSSLVKECQYELPNDFASMESAIRDFEEKLVTVGGMSHEDVSNDNKKSLIQHAIVKAFHSAHVAAVQEKDIPAGRNGATCVMAVLDQCCTENSTTTLHIAHVGDSRAILVNIVPSNDQTPFTVTQLSLETTVNKIDTERARIEKGEGSIRGNNVFYGPVGIAMTRSLGNDVMLRAGVVPTPVVESFPLCQTTTNTTSSDSKTYLVLGTDGIWDVLSNEAVANILLTNSKKSGTAQAACNQIASETRKKWVGDLPIVDEEKVDDITCMVLELK